MSPRPKTYETEEERREAHRRRQAKYRLKKKLETLERQRHEEKQRIAETSRVIMKSAEKDETSINSGDKEHHIACEWCGCLMGDREGLRRLCNFCRQFNSREEMLAEKKWHHTERLLKKMGDHDLIRKLKTEFRQAWKCSRCGTLNPYYKQHCITCGAPKQGMLIVKGGKLDSEWNKKRR